MADNFGPGPDGPSADNYNVDPRPDRGDDRIQVYSRWHPTGLKK